ncbi:hypothetical protein [Micromonospora wenchangensis]|uniref:hypothetical protein n=1 Tax=Micromonospora wenchangensis TaxID=1185415 RepID=UPI0038247DE4
MNVPYVAHIPYLDQPERWKQADRDEWLRLRRLADDEVLYGSLRDAAPSDRRRLATALLHKRNDGMLNGVPEMPSIGPADVCVAVWLPSKRDGGTFSAIKKAHKRGTPVVHINPDARTVTMPSRAALARLLHPAVQEPLFDPALR